MSGLTVGATTEDTIAERIAIAILPTYLTATIAIVDAANNSLALSADAIFTTPAATIRVAEHVARYYGNPIEITVVATGQAEDTGGESEQYHDHAPHVAKLPRLDLTTDIAINIRVSATDGGHGQDWARRCCNRITRAVRIIMAKYPEGDAPGYTPALATLWQDCKSTGDARGPLTEEEAWVTYARRLSYAVRTIEYRS